MTSGPEDEPDPSRRDSIRQALEYMDLDPGTAIAGVAVDRVFIGSCTNSRLSDLPADEVAIRGRYAPLPGSDPLSVYAYAHRAARFAPLEAGPAKDSVETFRFRLSLDLDRSGHHPR